MQHGAVHAVLLAISAHAKEHDVVMSALIGLVIRDERCFAFALDTILSILSISVVSEVGSELSIIERVLKYFLWYSIEM